MKGLYILIKVNTMNPVFGKIVDLVTLKTLFISVLEYVGKAFCPHYNAFFIKSKSVISAHDVNSLIDHRPFYARSFFLLQTMSITFHCLTVVCCDNSLVTKILFCFCICCRSLAEFVVTLLQLL